MRRLVLVPTLLLVFTAATYAAEVEFRIKAQPLANALATYAEQADLQVLFPQDSVRGLYGREVRGKLEKERALQLLLEETGLQASFAPNGTVLVKAISVTANGIDPTVHMAQAETPSSSNREVLDEDQKQASGAAASSEAGKSKVAEIIVTAQKRQERLQDVPISITALRGEDLDRSTTQSATEILSRVPGVAASSTYQGGGTTLSVRGVTAANPLFSGTSPVAYYIDSVPFGLVRSSILPDANIYDLDRIEILRGPQGTLYGASAQNGVVRILTKDADLGQFDWKARGAFSSTENGGNNARADMAVNIPLVPEKLAARAVLGYEDSDGWIDGPSVKDVNNAEAVNGRFKINAQPTEQLAIGLSAWLSRGDYGAPSSSANNRTTPYENEPITTDYDVYGLKVGYEFSRFSLSSSTSYIDYENRGFLDNRELGELLNVPGLRLETRLGSTVFSEEINLRSTSEGPWLWSIGAMYRDGDEHLIQFFGPLTPRPVDFTDDSESFAVFSELTRKMFDGKWELTAGLRYFEDEVRQRENVLFSSAPGAVPLRTESRFDQVSPRVTLTWHPSGNFTGYASYSEGFRSGSDQNPIVSLQAPNFGPLKEDTLKNYELGAKGRLGNRLTFDTAVFFIDWQDVQQPISVPYGGDYVNGNVNGESASGLGFEFATNAELAEGLDLGLSFGWNDLAVDADVLTFPAAAPQGVVLFPKGSRLNGSPEITAGASIDYTFPLGSAGYRGRLSASGNYTSARYARALADTATTVARGDPLLFARGSFAIDFPNRWTAALYIENASNEDDSSASTGFNPERSARPQPRTIGLQIEFHL